MGFKLITIMLFMIHVFIVAAGAFSNKKTSLIKPTRAIIRTCSRTLYPDLCVKSLADFPGSLVASERDLIPMTVNMTLQQFERALSHVTTAINNLKLLDDDDEDHMQPHVRAVHDCHEHLDGAVYDLSRAMESIAGTGEAAAGSTDDVMTWISSTKTCHEYTCAKGLSEMASNCVAIYAAASDYKAVENRRRMMSSTFPTWVSKKDRYLLDAAVSKIPVDIVVSKDGTGTVKTIAEAIKKAPENSVRRTIIHVKAGRYEEGILKVGRKKTNLMFIGDGKGKTIISGHKNVYDDHLRTFDTATFATSGSGFIARDMTFENRAGPEKNQSVALLISADQAVIYRCSIMGYQDTLYVHCNRQFFRECDVYGTVDFIFGNSAVVFQKCNLYARKPMAWQKNTITAQKRGEPCTPTGISIHACKILVDPDLEWSSKGSFATYLGRPWGRYSRTVYMKSYLGDHIHPMGWLEWNDTFSPVETLYYGEYQNYGPGSAVDGRVKWPGYHVITTKTEASKFTVGQFIQGSSWLPATGVAFMPGLSN